MPLSGSFLFLILFGLGRFGGLGRLYGEFIRLDGLLHLSKTPLHIPVDGIGRPLDIADESLLLLDFHPGAGLAHFKHRRTSLRETRRVQKTAERPVKKSTGERRNKQKTGPDAYRHPGDLQIVVAFRMLPEIVWNMPRLGTFNLHASLLPQYRGAAPINWAVINGDTETGITTFFLKHEIDTGEIIQQVRVPIADTDNVEIVHDKLMYLECFFPQP